jgi:hypothetical protein
MGSPVVTFENNSGHYRWASCLWAVADPAKMTRFKWISPAEGNPYRHR